MIWLLRHGDAEDGAGKADADRELTEKGERQSRWAGEALGALGVEPQACLSSPKVRARDTARIACEALGLEVTETEALSGGDFDPLELAGERDGVLLVGHEPDFSRAIGAVTGAKAKLKKGGIAAIEDGELHALLRPKDLRRIAES